MSPKRLTMATYGCPSQPVEYYQILQRLIATKLNVPVDLLYDTDRPGPDVSRGDQDVVDFAFVSTRYGLDLLSGDQSSAPFQVQPLGAITQHPDDAKLEVVGYYSAVVVRSDKSDATVKNFLDLRGSKLAYSDENSLSGMTALLSKLKQSGENAAFFSNRQKCGSHLQCLDALVNHEMEVTVVDSLALCTYLRLHPRLSDKLRHVFTWGPHPPQPFIVNASMDNITRMEILSILRMIRSNSGDLGSQAALRDLQPFGVLGFGEVNQEVLAAAQDMVAQCKKLKVDVTYY